MPKIAKLNLFSLKKKKILNHNYQTLKHFSWKYPFTKKKEIFKNISPEKVYYITLEISLYTNNLNKGIIL